MKTAPLPSEITQTTHSASAAKGVPLDYIILGCLQPGQSSFLYTDAVRVVSDKLHYLSFSGDGSTAEKRYYRFNTRANLRKEMEDRKTVLSLINKPFSSYVDNAYSFCQVSGYIGYASGESWGAKNTWCREKKNIPKDMRNELVKYAAEYSGYRMIDLVKDD